MALTNKTLAQLSKTATTVIATDLMQTSRAGEDYKATFDVVAKNLLAELFDNYHIRQAAKDISGADQETDLAQYQPGGASAKLSGFRIQITVTGGTGTAGFSHTLDTVGTDTYTVGGLAASVWESFGEGSYTLGLDTDNTNWIFVDPDEHIFDTWSTSAGSITYAYSKKIKNEIILTVDDQNNQTTNGAAGQVYYVSKAYTIPTAITGTKKVGHGLESVTTTVWFGSITYTDTTHFTTYILGHRNTAAGKLYIILSGTWR